MQPKKLSWRARVTIQRRREIESRQWCELLRHFQWLIGELS